MLVYFIDNNWNKQIWFTEILRMANQISGDSGISFMSGFGEDPRVARDRSCQPTQVLDALKANDALYLVDLGMPANDLQLQGGPDLPDLFQQEGGLFARALFELQELIKPHGEPEIELAAQDPDNHWGLLIICYCRLAEKTTMLVSTDGKAAYAEAVKFHRLATVTPAGFPFGSFELASPTNREIYLQKWATEILRLALSDPLARLRAQTKNWFRFAPDRGWRSTEESGLPHDHDITLDLNYSQFLSEVLPWLPSSCGWWTDKGRTVALHQCLKSSVGYHAQWMGGAPINPLSLGGAYLIFLIALGKVFPGKVNDFLVPHFGVFMQAGSPLKPLAFLPSQEQVDAERTVRALYEFFSSIIHLKEANASQLGRPREIGLERIEPLREGATHFRLKVKWTPDQIAECAASLRSTVEEGFSIEKIDLPRGKVIGSFLRFLISSQVRKKGMGPVGTISLDDFGWLKVGW
jgi:hypothetical protein